MQLSTLKTRPDARTGLSRGGWAGAVMWRAVRSTVYTTASVAFDWAGAVMKKLLAKCQKH